MIPSYIRYLHNCILIAMHDYILSILVSALSEHEMSIRPLIHCPFIRINGKLILKSGVWVSISRL